MFEHEDNKAKTMNNQDGTWVAIIYIKNQIGYSYDNSSRLGL